jgi:hypothetical protein
MNEKRGREGGREGRRGRYMDRDGLRDEDSEALHGEEGRPGREGEGGRGREGEPECREGGIERLPLLIRAWSCIRLSLCTE